MRKAIAMIAWKILNSMPISKLCKGAILSARIYADVKGNKCLCGGIFSKREPYKKDSLIILPVCSLCGEDPALYVIDATVKDDNGNKVQVRIRNTTRYFTRIKHIIKNIISWF